MSEQLKIRELITGEYVEGLRWENNKFYVWVSYWQLKEFVDGLSEMFGQEVFDDCGIAAYIQNDGVCIELDVLENYLDLEDVFPHDCGRKLVK